jgi:hypothetical protein
LKSFSEAFNQQFKIHNIPAEQLKPIEESMKELGKEVENIEEPEKISSVQNLKDFNFIRIASKL